MGVDRGFGTTREVGQELQKRIQGSDAHKRRSPLPEANSPSLSSIWVTSMDESGLSTVTPGICICLQPVLYHGRLIGIHRLYVVSWVYA